MKIKYKLIMDAALLVLLIVLMKYSWTGGLIHELLGLISLIGFGIHIFFNRKYYGAMLKAIKNGKANTKGKALFVINTVLLIASCTMLLSSVAISRDLLPSVSAFFTGNIWVPMHIASAVTMLVAVLAHVCMHFNLFDRLIENVQSTAFSTSLKKGSLRVLAVLFAVFVVKNSFTNMTNLADLMPSAGSSDAELNPESKQQDNELIIEEESPSEDGGYAIELEPEPEPEEEAVSLEEYLSSLFCNQCGRHCSLLSPRCGRGVEQASAAEAEFYQIYGDQAV